MTQHAHSNAKRPAESKPERKGARVRPEAAPASNLVWRALALRTGAVLQPKLAVGQPSDPYEQEADRVADEVTSAAAPPQTHAHAPRLQRACACGGSCPKCAGEENEVRRVRTKRVGAGGEARSDAPPSVEAALRSTAAPLDAGTRAFMESRFGHDFGGVRVHTDAKAAESAREVNALAYTVGSDIVLGAGAPAPQTGAGRKLLAHELTHVLQQSGGGTSSPALQRWSLSNCDKAQTDAINGAFRQSYADLTFAKSVISPPTTLFVQNALWLAFRNASEEAAEKARKAIGKLEENIKSTHITCQPKTHADCKGNEGYHQDGKLYLCMPTYTDLDEIDQANTLTHEAAHKYLDVRDTGYFTPQCEETATVFGVADKDSGTEGDNPVLRFNNADAYSCFVHYIVRHAVANVQTLADQYTGRTLTIEGKEKHIYTVTETASRDDGAFHIEGAPPNSGFRYKWKLVTPAGDVLPLTALNKSTRADVFSDEVTSVYVPKETRQALEAKKVTKATIICEVQLFKHAPGGKVPLKTSKSIEIDVYHKQDPMDTSQMLTTPPAP